METIKIGDAVITDEMAEELAGLQGEPENNFIDIFCENLTAVSNFLIDKREYLQDDKQILDHVVAIRDVIGSIKVFRIHV